MKKILIISETPTHPTNAGNRNAILSQSQILKELGCDVYFLYVQNEFENKNDFIATQEYWKDHFFFFKKNILYKWKKLITNKYRKVFFHWTWKCDDSYVPFLSKYVNQLNKQINFDICIINYYNLTKLFLQIEIAKKAIFTHDSFSYKNLVIGRNVEGSIDASNEAKALQRCPYIFALQDNEAIFFQRLSPKSKVYTVYSNFTFKELPLQNENINNILFLSGPNQYNINGITWFLEEVFPIINQQYPNTKLLIGGGICNYIKKDNINSNIVLQGQVKNIEDFYSQGNIVINPVYEGTGIKIKTLEALSFGKCIITRTHSTEGLYDKNSAPILYSDDPIQWVQFIEQILKGEISLIDIKEKAHIYIDKMHNYIYKQYKDFIED